MVIDNCLGGVVEIDGVGGGRVGCLLNINYAAVSLL